MKRLILAAGLAAAPPPARVGPRPPRHFMRRIKPHSRAAAPPPPPLAGHAQDSSDEGSNAIEEGAQLFLRGLLEEVQPPLQELAGIGAKNLLTLQALVDEMGPAFAEVFEQIDSISYYQPPEILPNGDIVFRRNADSPAWEPAEARPEATEPEPPAPEPPTPEPSEPEEEAPWWRAPPAVPDNELRIDPSRDLEL